MRKRKPKLAYEIDPLMKASLTREPEPEFVPTRVNGEVYADDFWKEKAVKNGTLHTRFGKRLRARELAVLFVLTLGLAISFAPDETEAERVVPVSVVSEDQTTQVQMKLRSYGYSIVVDGIYGPQTTRAVKHFQRANGLEEDGIAGPITRSAMGLQRSGDIPVASGTPTSTNYKCPQLVPLMQKYGLPVDFFDPVAHRESRCNPSAYNGRGRDNSYGIFQLNTYGNLWGELSRRCNLTTKEQLFEAETNVRCASVLYSVYGKSPWRVN